MIRRIEFWQHALWIAFALALANATPAHALITVEGRQSATFEWVPAAGPVVKYAVLLKRADVPYLTLYSEVVGRTSETVEAPYGKSFTVYVVAFDALRRVGPLSEPSEAVVFVPAADPPPATDPPPDPTDPPPDPPDPTDPPPDPPLPPVAPTATPFDFDGDDNSDLLVRGGLAGDVELWSMDGQGVADVASVPGAGRYGAIVGNGDYDGDGLADILWNDRRSRSVSVFFMDGSHIRETAVLTEDLGSGSSIVGSGDYDGDGLSDVLTYTASLNQFSVWTMTGVGAFELSVLPDDFRDEAEIIASGDFDGDGMADILWRHPPSGDVDIWGLTRDLSLGPLEGSADEWSIIGAGDFDGDYLDDLLLREPGSDLLAVRLSTRGVRDEIDYAHNTASSDRQVVATGDYDGDGRTDLVVYDGDSGAFEVWYMSGSAVTHGAEIDSPSRSWEFASVDERKPGSR